MKHFLLFLLSISFGITYSQNSVQDYLDKTLIELKKESKIDSRDKRALTLLDSFYNETLQSEKGELSPITAKKLETYLTTDKIPNNHILILFLMYQEYITQTEINGKKANTEYQLASINLLENEIKSIYSKVPTIIYVYKFEALEADNKKEEATQILELGLNVSADSIPLKVYKFLNTKDDKIKTDLVNNHKNHWMVQQFGIK